MRTMSMPRRGFLLIVIALVLAAAGCVTREPMNPFAPPSGTQPLP